MKRLAQPLVQLAKGQSATGQEQVGGHHRHLVALLVLVLAWEALSAALPVQVA